MKIKSIAAMTISFIAGVLLTMSSFVFAQGQEGSSSGADQLVGGYGKNNQTPANINNPFSLFFQNPYSTQEDQLSSSLYNGLFVPFETSNPTDNPNQKQNPMSGQTLTDLSSYQMMTTTNPLQTVLNSLAIPAPMAGVSTTTGPDWIGILTGNTNNTQQHLAPTASFSQDSLLLPSEYDQSSKDGTTPQQTAALNFINFTTGQNDPAPVLDFSSVSPAKLKAALTTAPDTALIDYLSKLRTFTALQSIANSNLYYLYSERVPQSTKDLAKAIPQITSDPAIYPQASTLAVEQFLATYRYNNNASWLQALGTMTPAQLQREQLLLMRDMLFEEFQTHMVMERILTATTATQLEAAAQIKVQLKELYNNALKSSVFTGG